jgi:Ulp1 family protease
MSSFGNNVHLKSEIDLNYIYANIMQQPDHSSCGLFVIAYVVDITLNLNVKK